MLPAIELYFVGGSCEVLFFPMPGGGSSGGPWDSGGFADLILHMLALYYPGTLNYKSSLQEQEFSKILANTSEHKLTMTSLGEEWPQTRTLFLKTMLRKKLY